MFICSLYVHAWSVNKTFGSRLITEFKYHNLSSSVQKINLFFSQSLTSYLFSLLIAYRLRVPLEYVWRGGLSRNALINGGTQCKETLIKLDRKPVKKKR